MKRSPMEHKLMEVLSPVAEDLGFALVDISLVTVERGRTLQILAENKETQSITIGECADLSRQLSAHLDVEDLIEGHYILEVGSPGIDRPLTRLQDFEDWKGYEAKIELDMPLDSGRRRFRGPLGGVKESDLVSITVDGEEFNLNFSDISRAKLVLTDDLIKKTTKQKEA